MTKEEWQTHCEKQEQKIINWYKNNRYEDDELLCKQLLGDTSGAIRGDDFKPEILRERLSKAKKELDKARRILEKQAKAGVQTISCYDYCNYSGRGLYYPYTFTHTLMGNNPLLLHVLGDASLLSKNYEENVTIIGSREADQEGLDAAYQLGRKYAEEGKVVVSGLALGCDTAAHRGCLDAEGKTIAIVASGLDITHPKANRKLQDEIVEKGGLIITEHPFGVKANPTRLVARCRLQAVYSESIIVAQCPYVSGTMYTVFFTHKYDGDLWSCETTTYAVEYNKYNDKSSGNKFLIEHKLAIPINV